MISNFATARLPPTAHYEAYLMPNVFKRGPERVHDLPDEWIELYLPINVNVVDWRSVWKCCPGERWHVVKVLVVQGSQVVGYPL